MARELACVQRLQERLKELKERNLCREEQIRLSVDDLVTLELELEAALQVLRDSKGVYDHGIPHVFASAGLQPNQLNLVEDTKSVLTSCSDSNCSINQPDLGYETESNITSSYSCNQKLACLKARRLILDLSVFYVIWFLVSIAQKTHLAFL